MTIGIAVHPRPGATNVVDDLVEQAEVARDLGIDTVWLSQQFAYDALTAASALAARVPDIRIGTSVVTIGPRHPRGQDRDLPPTHVHRRRGQRGDPRPRGRHGPQALQVTGELADGTIPLFAGPRTLSDYLVPAISQAAAGRSAPAIVADVAVTVTSDPDRVRANAVEQLAFHDTIPSYHRIVAREGLQHAHQLAVIGDEATVTAELQRYRDSGATELLVTQTDLGGPEDELRTLELLGSLAAGS